MSQIDAEVEIDVIRRELMKQISDKNVELGNRSDKIEKFAALTAELRIELGNRTREVSHLETEATSKMGEMEKLQNQNLEITQHMENTNLEKEEVINSNVFLINELNDKNETIDALCQEKEEINKEITKLEVTLEGNRYSIGYFYPITDQTHFTLISTVFWYNKPLICIFRKST